MIHLIKVDYFVKYTSSSTYRVTCRYTIEIKTKIKKREIDEVKLNKEEEDDDDEEEKKMRAEKRCGPIHQDLSVVKMSP